GAGIGAVSAAGVVRPGRQGLSSPAGARASPRMSTVCHQCGATLLPLSARCPACGTLNVPPVSWTAVTLTPEAAPPGVPAPRPPPGGAAPAPGSGGVALGPLVPGMSFGRRYHIKRL